MKLAIADPPYPPIFAERFDTADDGGRLTVRSRARRWYGDGTRAKSDSAPADFHPDAGRWDDVTEHRRLMEQLLDEYDGWAIATAPDGLGAYHPLPVSAHVAAWVRPNGMPSGGRLLSRREPVIVFVPESRRRGEQLRIPDVLTAAAPRRGFAGAKPAEWTRWVLAMLGYAPGADTVADIFTGSGAVAAAADGLLPIEEFGL